SHGALRARISPRTKNPGSLRGLRSFARRKVQRHAIDAIAQSSGWGAIGKHMAQMAAACGTVHLGALHAEAAVGGGLHRSGQWIVEPRPAGAALEFERRGKERRIATGAGKYPLPMLVQQGARAGPLGAVLTHDSELLRRQFLSPFRLAAGHGKSMGVHGCTP